MVDTKKDLTVKEVLGILLGTFGFLFTSITNGMEYFDAILISAVIAGLGFVYAWFGVKKVSITTLGEMLLSILKIVTNKTKDVANKMLEIEVLIKKEMEVLNFSWETLNESGEGALKTIADVAKAAADLPGKLGEIGKAASVALDALKPASEPLK